MSIPAKPVDVVTGQSASAYLCNVIKALVCVNQLWITQGNEALILRKTHA